MRLTHEAKKRAGAANGASPMRDLPELFRNVLGYSPARLSATIAVFIRCVVTGALTPARSGPGRLERHLQTVTRAQRD